MDNEFGSVAEHNAVVHLSTQQSSAFTRRGLYPQARHVRREFITLLVHSMKLGFDLASDNASQAGAHGALASWYAPGLSDELGDRLLMFDNSSGPSLELLRFRPEFTATPGFEVALRRRVERLSRFHHPSFARVHAVEYLGHGEGLALLSNHTPGRRLSEIIQGAKGPTFATTVIRQLTPALASLQEYDGGSGHGVLTPSRIVITPEGRLTIVEYVLGPALQRLQLPARRLAELGIALPPAAAACHKFDGGTDYFQLGLIALSLLLGHRLAPDESPQNIAELLAQLARAAEREPAAMPHGLLIWLERALQLTDRVFESPADAQDALRDLERLRPALPTAPPAQPVGAEPDGTSPPPQTPGASAAPPAGSPVVVRQLPPPGSRFTLDLPNVPQVGQPMRASGSVDELFESETERPSHVQADPDAKRLERVFEPVPPRPAAGMPLAASMPPASPQFAVREDEEPGHSMFIELDAWGPRPSVSPVMASVSVTASGSVALSVPSSDSAPPAPAASRSQGEPLRASTPVAASVPVSADLTEEAPAAAGAPQTANAPQVVTAPPASGALPIAGALPTAGAPPTMSLPAASVTAAAPQPHSRLSPDRPRATSMKSSNKGRPNALQLLASILAACVVGEALIIALLLQKRGGAAAAPSAILVETLHPGADVIVDGRSAGVTPVQLSIEPGIRSIRVDNTPSKSSADETPIAGNLGSDTSRAPTRPDVGTAGRVPPAPQRFGGIRLSSPIEVDVFEGDRRLGSSATGIVSVPAGRHELELVNSRLGYRAREIVEIRGGQVVSMQVSPPNGRLSVNAVPWAEVWIDGRLVGETPLGNLSVPLGEHEVVFRHPQLGEQRQTATVRLDGVTRLSVNLQR